MDKNSESIYGTSPSPFPSELPWGFCTTRGELLYLHVFDWPADGILKLDGLNNRIRNAFMLTDRNTKLKVNRDKGGQLQISCLNSEPTRFVLWWYCKFQALLILIPL